MINNTFFRNNLNHYGLIAYASLVAFSLIVFILPVATHAAQVDKVTICHNGHVISVPASGFENGHNGDFIVEGNIGDSCQTPPEQATSISVVASKVVCNSESDLPNWGEKSGTDGHPSGITATTATDYVASHPNCHLEDGWSFEWGIAPVDDPGRDYVGVAPSGFTTFGPTVSGMVSTDVLMSAFSESGQMWLREVLKDGFIPFTYDWAHTDVDNISAEFYCGNDQLNYDNFESIQSPVAGTTYYCVAFNAPKAEEVIDVCPNIEGTQTVVPEGMEINSDKQCVSTTPTPSVDTDVCPNIDGAQATVPDGKVLKDGQCVAPSSGGRSSGSRHSGGGGGSVQGQVLGASCGLYMDKHLRLGSKKNDPEQTKKLQTFLNKWMGTNLPINGIYGKATENAVKAFQKKYGSDILTPWSIGAPTGLVYFTTLHKINELECPEAAGDKPSNLIDWSKNPKAQ